MLFFRIFYERSDLFWSLSLELTKVGRLRALTMKMRQSSPVSYKIVKGMINFGSACELEPGI